MCHTFYHHFRRDTHVLMHQSSLQVTDNNNATFEVLMWLMGPVWVQQEGFFFTSNTLSCACVHMYERNRVCESVCWWTAHITQVNCSAWVNESHCVHPSTANLKRLSHVLPPTYVCCRALAAVAQRREGNLIAEFKNRKQGSSSMVEDYSQT